MPYKEYKICITPNLDSIIWRYMSLEKFELLLADKSLFFCRADKFADPFEGTIPLKEAEYRKKTWGDEESIKSISNFHIRFKGHLLVNCWHINNSENDAMWRLYLKDNDGVAIQTTVRNLLDSLKNTNEDIYCTKIRYIDFEKDIWLPPIDSYNMFAPIIHKRQEFTQENEVRLIHRIDIVNDINEYWQKQPKENGKDISIDINKLIIALYSAPTSDKTQIDRVKNIAKKLDMILT
jgi:hypothetical protein